jgi:hypothetical protein
MNGRLKRPCVPAWSWGTIGKRSIPAGAEPLRYGGSEPVCPGSLGPCCRGAVLAPGAVARLMAPARHQDGMSQTKKTQLCLCSSASGLGCPASKTTFFEPAKPRPPVTTAIKLEPWLPKKPAAGASPRVVANARYNRAHPTAPHRTGEIFGLWRTRGGPENCLRFAAPGVLTRRGAPLGIRPPSYPGPRTSAHHALAPRFAHRGSRQLSAFPREFPRGGWKLL